MPPQAAAISVFVAMRSGRSASGFDAPSALSSRISASGVAVAHDVGLDVGDGQGEPRALDQAAAPPTAG